MVEAEAGVIQCGAEGLWYVVAGSFLNDNCGSGRVVYSYCLFTYVTSPTAPNGHHLRSTEQGKSVHVLGTSMECACEYLR